MVKNPRTEREWSERLRQIFHPGDRVEVTQQYVGSGRFSTSGDEGIYTVVRALEGGPDYYIKRESRDSGLPWDLICHVTRLLPA